MAEREFLMAFKMNVRKKKALVWGLVTKICSGLLFSSSEHN